MIPKENLTKFQKDDIAHQRSLRRKEALREVGGVLRRGAFIGIVLTAAFGVGLMGQTPIEQLVTQDNLASPAFCWEFLGGAIAVGTALSAAEIATRRLVRHIRGK